MFRSSSVKKGINPQQESYDRPDEEALLPNSAHRSSGIHRGASLVRPERNNLKSPDNPHHYYAQKAAQEQGHLNVLPSNSGVDPLVENRHDIPLEDLKVSKPTPKRDQKKPLTLWQMYCYIVTFWAPAPLMALCGMPKKERQFAWREKVALITIIFAAAAGVGFLTFGFSRTVCSSKSHRLKNENVGNGMMSINGRAYDLTSSSHPGAVGIPAGSNVLYPPVNGDGMDASFLFQNVNGNCLGVIKPRDNCTIPRIGDELAWYMPCQLIARDGSSQPNFTTNFYPGWACHTSPDARDAYFSLQSSGDIYFTWDDVKNTSRNLVVFSGVVLDLDRLNWLQTDDLEYPALFDKLKGSDMKGYDISLVLSDPEERKMARCLTEIIKVGSVDAQTVGCIASDIVLILSLIFIMSIVLFKFFVALYFRWFVAPKQGAVAIDNGSMIAHNRAIENWSANAHSQGPLKQVDPALRPVKKSGHQRSASKMNLRKSSRMSMAHMWDHYGDNEGIDGVVDGQKNNVTMATQAAMRAANNPIIQTTGVNPFDAPFVDISTLDARSIHPDVVMQPPVDFMPAGFPLIHTICFVTCYSEDEDGLRTTLDSLSTTDYPNSHKLLVVVCDGLIKGSGNDRTTPEIALGMMSDLVVPEDQVQPYSYVAVAAGAKRHNMAKVYAGFYKYDDNTVAPENQQRVPIITIVKCGTAAEQGSAKPGNRGKRDSQIILMSFLQKITFDERMTELEFEILRNIWQVTGLMADFYESVLMVDADTKVFPDCLTHMNAELVHDPMIMGLCGETKIYNKAQSWVTAIQVFEYYISHHLSKSFESVFGSVTCLPGCFSMYRIKTPKGTSGYWVPILANPDIVERYSDNVTDTLHKKNLLLLGEDRYLSSLMLRTFPKRKQVFVPKAACKTIVPDVFKVLLSQRRRWINSTVHNLMELVLIRDLCGTFCFSMQFVIFIELIGTLVLPLALCFTIYVIVFAAVSHPTPIITLVMLAVILGLPGLLIIITATSWSYIMWMAIYLIALPIWNFVLPSYAYWKFDDFSWGDTRTIAGGNKAGGGHDEEEGEFDHSKIKMRRWREFESESRRQNQTVRYPTAAWDGYESVPVSHDSPGVNHLEVPERDGYF